MIVPMSCPILVSTATPLSCSARRIESLKSVECKMGVFGVRRTDFTISFGQNSGKQNPWDSYKGDKRSAQVVWLANFNFTNS